MNAPKDRRRQLGPCPRQSLRVVDDVSALATVDECSCIHVDSDSESDMTVSSNIASDRASELLGNIYCKSSAKIAVAGPECSSDSSTIRLYKMSSSPARENLPEQWIMDSGLRCPNRLGSGLQRNDHLVFINAITHRYDASCIMPIYFKWISTCETTISGRVSRCAQSLA